MDDITTDLHRQIQQASCHNGCDPEPIDGQLGAKAKAVIIKLYRDNKLFYWKCDIEILKALGVLRLLILWSIKKEL